ncbi:Trypsin [Popillia japonica]|uniref:Trypsin n=1 Tax=Popillia japonica TaxID=7064 RepID=A0AAW1IX37_POPJA
MFKLSVLVLAVITYANGKRKFKPHSVDVKCIYLYSSAGQLTGSDKTIDDVANWRVVGGTNGTAAGAYPFVVSLRSSSNNHFCGDSILNTRWGFCFALCNWVGAESVQTELPVALNAGDTGAVAAILIGWGRISTNGAILNKLQELSTNTITHTICRLSWGSLVSSDQICAVTRSGQGAWSEDLGGPLI